MTQSYESTAESCYDCQAAKMTGISVPDFLQLFVLEGCYLNEVYRQEKKYFMTLFEMKKLSGQLDQVMLQDAHNGANGYNIRSLYFDTINERDYEAKIDGLELRRKIRLRIYDPAADFAMLEMKQKEGSYQKKRSLRVSREDAIELTKGRYHSLLKYADPFAAECYGLMHMECYRPKTIVEYKRKAYIAKENKIRITFDHQIQATESCMDLFAPDLNMYPVLDRFNGVLEVKYNGFLLSYIKKLVNEANRSELSVSKYCLARSVTMKFAL